MRRLLTLAILALTLSAEAATYYTYTLTVTNMPLGAGATNIVVGAVTRWWTNAYAPTTILTNLANGTNGVATNLFSSYGRYPQSGVTVRQSGVSELTFRTIDLGVSVNGNWASVVTNSTTGTNLWALMLPPENLPAGAQRTNANHLVTYLGTHATSNIPQTAKALTNFVSVGQAQDVTNKTLYSVTVKSGTVSNVTLYATGGYVSSTILDNIIATNIAVYGGFTSQGSGSLAEAIGAAADASGNAAIAIGSSAIAGGDESMAIGVQTVAGGLWSIAIGNSADASSTAASNSVAIGVTAQVTAADAIAIGAAAVSGYSNAVAIGKGAASTATDQIMLGASTHTVRVPGVLSAATSTNSIHTGTNYVQNIPRVGVQVVTTLVGSQDNILPTVTAPLIEITTTAGGFGIKGIPAGTAGQTLTVVNLTAGGMTNVYESASESGPTNRIITMTGANRITTGMGVAKYYYSGTSNRWMLISLDE